MIRTKLALLVVLGLLACGQGSQSAAGRDSTERNLALAPVSGGGALNDRPVSAVPSTRTLGAGGVVGATIDQTITSRSNRPGQTVNTTVDADVRNSAGRVVIPAGSAVALLIVEISPAKSKSAADGTLTLQVTSVTVRGRQYPLSANVTSVAHTLKGRGITAGEVEKVGVGAAIGAIAGQVIGGNAKGTIIGGAVGAAGGTVVAVETASRDVVVSAGTPMILTLTQPLTVSLQ
jgi:hypothetical protein